MASDESSGAAELPAWRRFPIGAERSSDGSWHVRVWAPRAKNVDAVVRDGEREERVRLTRSSDGHHAGSIGVREAGARYGFSLDGGPVRPDPASRWQPEGPHELSALVDPSAFKWSDATWRGPSRDGQVIYELHVGTFTPEGTFGAAMAKLPMVAEVGVSMIEIMPVADFPGRFGWGYDGVEEFAPYHAYGPPDDLSALVDRAHSLGVAVILDVVYNHLGPDGCYLREFSDTYFKGSTEWGDALNFDGEGSAGVREFFITNAAYWIEEFHFDGLRLDATQQIFDATQPHVLREVGEAVRRAAKNRSTFIVAENEPQYAKLVRGAKENGYGLNAIWNDDFHHSAFVALTGRSEAYYTDYRGTPQELVSSAKYGFLFQGQWYRWQNQRRGVPSLDLPPDAFVVFTENHDQIANSVDGERISRLTSPPRCRAMMALLLLMPQTPMLFQGQEFSASAPFTFFADHGGELAKLVREGRKQFVGQFPSHATAEMQALVPDPSAFETFARCKLDWTERDRNAGTLAMVADLIALRRNETALVTQRAGGDNCRLDGAVIGDDAFVLRWMTPSGTDDRLLVVNLGRRLELDLAPEPLLAPPNESLWRPKWSSQSAKYGGSGTAAVDTDDAGWRIPAESALLMHPVAREKAEPAKRGRYHEREQR